MKTLQSDDNSLVRVVIIHRSDGHYGLRTERWATFDGVSVPPRWISTYAREGIYASIEIAEAEAYAAFPWVHPKQPAE